MANCKLFVSLLQKTIDNLAIFQDSMIRSMFKFVQGAAHIWDTHEVGLAKQERALQVYAIDCYSAVFFT